MIEGFKCLEIEHSINYRWLKKADIFQNHKLVQIVQNGSKYLKNIDNGLNQKQI